jgi:phage shock protein E
MSNTAIFVLLRKRRIQQALQKGAVIIDIREPLTFDNGHATGAVNIPKIVITANISRLRKLKAPLLICGSSYFSCIATVGLLQSYGFEVINGGNYNTVNRLKQETQEHN